VTFDNPNFSLANKMPVPLEPNKPPTVLQIKFDNKPEYANTGRMMITAKG
jgi:hypothetical protein